MQLAELVCAYVAAKNEVRPIGNDLAAKTCERLFECARVYSKHLERPATTDDFNAITVTAFLKQLLKNDYSPYTAKNRRTGLLVLWRFAHDQQLAVPCDGVRPIACPPLVISGYDFAAMQTILAFVATLRGVIRGTGISKSVFWDSFLRTDWDIGLRIGDMLRVEPKHFDPKGWLWFSESKTSKAGWKLLRATTTAAIVKCLAAAPGRCRIWPGFNRKNSCRAFSELAKMAGINGTSKFIRSGGSSECDRLHPGTGWQHLRHSGPEVWEKHYRVDKICEIDRPMPPELPEPPPLT